MAVRHPLVAKAAAVGVPDTRLGEKVCLVVSSYSSIAPTAEDVLAHLDQQGLSTYDMPEYFCVVREFPLTASGKILKRKLSEQIEQGILPLVPVRFVAES